MALPYTFASVTTIVTSQFDDNFAALGALTAIPCAIVGTNALTLTPAADTPTVSAYQNYQPFTGIAVAANSGALTAQVGALPPLSVYKDTAAGPVALSGNEIQPDNAITLIYDSALSAGGGGFHLYTGGLFVPASGGSFTGNITVSGIEIGSGFNAATRMNSTVASITWTAIAPQTSQDQNVTVTGASVGDIALFGPPSSITAGIVLSAYVSAASVVTIRAANVTSGTITPAAANYRAGFIGF